MNFATITRCVALKLRSIPIRGAVAIVTGALIAGGCASEASDSKVIESPQDSLSIEPSSVNSSEVSESPLDADPESTSETTAFDWEQWESENLVPVDSGVSVPVDSGVSLDILESELFSVEGIESFDWLLGGSDGGGLDVSEEASEVGFGVLEHRRLNSAESVCHVGAFRSGDRVEFSADGFAPSSVVRLGVMVVTMTENALPPIELPSVTADIGGRISTVWTVPDTAGLPEGTVPRLYMAMAGGTDAAGDALLSSMFIPLVAYPGTVPCALDDSAVTSLGRSVRIPVLSNDVAPQGGELDPASVLVDPVAGGEFVLNPGDGSLTFTPDPGFVGTVDAYYLVFDNWGVSFQAEIVVTVNAGCTITGTVGVVDIMGTDGDDVICVPDPDDYNSFHVIDALGGNDIILGGNGVDWIYGGSGRDEVHARYGKDIITAGPGIDTIYGGGGFDTIHSANTADIIIDDPDGYELLIH